MTVQELEQKFLAAEERLQKQINLLGKYTNKYETLNVKYQEACKTYPLDDNVWVAMNWYEIPDDVYNLSHSIKQYKDAVADSERKIKDLTQVRDNWKTKLELEKAKESEFANIPQVVKDFVHNWRTRTYTFVINEISKAEVEYKNVQALHSKMYNFQYKSPEYNAAHLEYLAATEDYRRKFSPLARSLVFKHDQEKELNKILAVEEKTKIFDLIKRVTKVIGTITDASNLRIGEQSGELNGIVIGEDGKAKVETIGAGGYAIQCYHFRVLVKKLK